MNADLEAHAAVIAAHLEPGDLEIFRTQTWNDPKNIEATQRLSRAGLVSPNPTLTRRKGWLQFFRTKLGTEVGYHHHDHFVFSRFGHAILAAMVPHSELHHPQEPATWEGSIHQTLRETVDQHREIRGSNLQIVETRSTVIVVRLGVGEPWTFLGEILRDTWDNVFGSCLSVASRAHADASGRHAWETCPACQGETTAGPCPPQARAHRRPVPTAGSSPRSRIFEQNSPSRSAFPGMSWPATT